MPNSRNWGDLANDVILALEGGYSHDLPRIEFEASGSGGIIHMRARNRAPAPRGDLPAISLVAGWPSLCDLCLRAGIYIATWRGSSGAVVFIDVFNGNEKRRYEATTQRELESAVLAATSQFSGKSADERY